jgi:ubiquinone/menaquinone biosynthesis C-methylase UbiE
MSTATYRSSFSGSAAENYQRYFVPTIATAVSAELLRTADLKTGERVVDVACGTGLIARLAAQRVGPTGSVTGIDIAPEMIDVAKSVEAVPEPRIDWRVADAKALPLPDESYDVATCQMGLMFMDDRSGALAEIRRVLVPGGRIVVNTPGRIQPVFQHMEEAIVEHINPDLGVFVRAVFSMDEPDTLTSLLTDAGFHDVSASETSATLRLPAPAEFLWQYINLSPMGSFVANAPEAARSAMEEQVVKRWRPYVVDGGVVVEQPMIVATGRK